MQKKTAFIRILLGLFTSTIIFGFVVIKQQQPESRYDIVTTRNIDTDGNIHILGVENKKALPVAITFLEVGCVISQRMIPELNKIYSENKSKDIKFYGIISNSKATIEEARNFKTEFNIQFPLLFDANGDLAKRIKPTAVPECFVFDKNDKLIYNGRINDYFVQVGKVNKNPKYNELSQSIKAVLTNQLAPKSQPAIGCIFEPWPSKIENITYNKEIDPIIQANCVACHKPGDIGPFPLTNYNEVSRRGRMIEFVTRKKYMPIWKAEKSYGRFVNEHSLSDYEISLIKDWVNSGMKEGKKEDLIPKPETVKSEWKLGKPDLILEMEPYDLPASGDDQYRVFVMKNKIPKGKIIKAIDFKPGDPAVVHHSTIFVDYSNTLKKYDKEDPKPGYDAFKKGGTMEFGSAVPVCGWAPGVGPYSYPDDIGFYIEYDAHVAFENHYHLSGKTTTDKSYIGIYYADKPVTKYVTGSIIGTQKLQIPLNESNFKKTIWTYVPTDIELYDMTPHMHYIGKSVKVDVLLPNGQTRKLLKLNDWDLRWQSVYTLRDLMHIPKGSIIKAEFVFDNSNDNADNPNYPAKEMYWGWGSDDEMCEVYFSYVPTDPKDYGKMLASSFVSFEHFYPSTERTEVNSQNIDEIKDKFKSCDIWSNEGQQLLYSIVESRHSEEILALMNKEASAHKNDPNFTVNRSELILTEVYLTFDMTKIINEATKQANIMYKLINSDNANWNVKLSYAKIMIESEIKQYETEGLRILNELISEQEKLKPETKYAKAYWLVGKYYYSKRDDKKAEEILKQGLSFFPNDPDLKQELASDGRIVKKTLNQ